jgi:hypothetical protein
LLLLQAIPEDRDVLIQDVNYAATWEKCDYLYVKKLFAKIQIAEDYDDVGEVKELVEKYETKLRRRYNDQYVQDTPSDPAPTDVAVKNDVITNQGMGRLVSIIIGKTNERFLHYASGAGTSVATIGDQKLQDEKFRISMATDGFRTAAGTVARYGAVFIPSAPSHTVAESGVVTTATGGTFLNRTVYPSSQRVVHTIFENFFSLSLALYMSSV